MGIIPKVIKGTIIVELTGAIFTLSDLYHNMAF